MAPCARSVVGWDETQLLAVASASERARWTTADVPAAPGPVTVTDVEFDEYWNAVDAELGHRVEEVTRERGLAFVVASARWGDAEGQAMFIMILTLAAAEVAVGLGLIIQMYRRFQTVDISVLNEMKG